MYPSAVKRISMAVATLALLVFLFELPVWAQYNRSQVSGFVRDESGAAIPGVTVTIRYPSIALVRTSISDETGYYVIVDLPRGECEVSAEVPGFKKFRESGIPVYTETKLQVNVVLTVGQISEVVQVQAAQQQVEVNTGGVSQLLTGAELREIPLSGRNPFMMVGLFPGAMPVGGGFLGSFRATSFSLGAYLINGQRKDTNFLTIDGIKNVRNRDNVQVGNILGVDFIDEVKILTSTYSAELGRSSGTQIHFVTKRGTRDFGGTLFEFLGHDKLNARPTFASTKPRFRYHNFGWALGGPIFIPGKWNANKSKAFFFVGQEYRILGGFNSKQGIVPTAEERSGNFANSNLKAPIDPLTKQPFSNKSIPSSRFSPNGTALLKMYPLPNFSGPGGNYIAFASQPTDSREDIYRIDYSLRPRWQLTGRYVHDFQEFTSPFDLAGNTFPLFENFRGRSGNNFVLSLTNPVSSNTLNEFSYGYSDFREDITLFGAGLKRETYGINFREAISGNRLNRIPNVAISGFAGVNGSGNPTHVGTPSHQFRENFSKVIGTHALKFGAYVERGAMNDSTQANDNGSVRFGASAANPNSTGNALADVLLGNFDSYSESGSAVQVLYLFNQFEFYGQDSWKARKNLALEYGLRWSIIPPYYSAWNNWSAFIPAFYDPAKAPRLNANGSIVSGTGDLFNGIVLPGTGFPESAQGRFPQASDSSLQRLFRGFPRGYTKTHYDNLAPRVGFAWDIFSSGKSALRGGFGVFHNRVSIQHAFFYGGAPPFTEQVDITNGSVDNPSEGTLGTTQFPISIRTVDPEFKIPTVYKFSLGIQQELPWQTVIDISYVGNRGQHLLRFRDLNAVTAEVRRDNAGRDLRPFFSYYGLGSLSQIEPSSSSFYDSLQVSVNRRYHQGLGLSLAYTWSKLIGTSNSNEGAGDSSQDPFNHRLERGVSGEHRPHNLVFYALYELPFFRDQKNVMGRVLGGWQISAVTTFNTGRYFNPGLTGVARQIATRPDMIANPNLPRGQRTRLRYFNTEAFKRAADWTYGNSAREVIEGPGTKMLDMSLQKFVRLHENIKLQFRAEFFDAFNHPNFNGVATTLGASNFGQVTGVFEGGNRGIQVAMKLLF